MADVKEPLDELQVRYLGVRRDGAVVTVTIDRPERRNALHAPAHAELAAVFDAYTADRESRVLVLTGAGERAFCVGSDLKELARSGVDQKPATGFGGLTERFDLDKPVLAAVNGDAVGGGLELVLACDLALAVGHARFGLPEPRVGLAAHGGLHRLARQVPLKQAMDIALTGRLLSAEEALNYGLINAVVDAAELAAEVTRWTDALLAAAPLAVRATKQLMLRGLASRLRRGRLRRHLPRLRGDAGQRGRARGHAGVHRETRPRSGAAAERDRARRAVPCRALRAPRGLRRRG